MQLKVIERKVIQDTYVKNSMNKTHTARALGIGLRTLQRKLTKYTKEMESFNNMKSLLHMLDTEGVEYVISAPGELTLWTDGYLGASCDSLVGTLTAMGLDVVAQEFAPGNVQTITVLRKRMTSEVSK